MSHEEMKALVNLLNQYEVDKIQKIIEKTNPPNLNEYQDILRQIGCVRKLITEDMHRN